MAPFSFGEAGGGGARRGRASQAATTQSLMEEDDELELSEEEEAEIAAELLALGERAWEFEQEVASQQHIQLHGCSRSELGI